MLSGITNYLFGNVEEETLDNEDVRLRVTPVDDEWALVDRSRGRSKSPETGSMENLLLEHPSMSVYNKRGRPHSTGIESDEGDSPMTSAVVRSSPRRPRAVTTRAGLLPKTQLSKSMQQAKRRVSAKTLTRRHMDRHNKTYNLRSLGRDVRVQQPMKSNC